MRANLGLCCCLYVQTEQVFSLFCFVLCSLIQYCVKAGSYRGPEITPEEEEVEDLIQRFSAVSLLDCGLYNGYSPLSKQLL